MQRPPDDDLDVTSWAAVVLAGGTAARLDGVDKAGIEHAGRTLLEHALAATAGATETVVVGAPVPTTRPVTFTREEPPRGGPAAGLLAGVDALAGRPRRVAVLAVDMPRVGPATFARLLRAAEDHEGAFLVDTSGRRALAGVVDVVALRRVRPDDAHGLPLHRLLAPLHLAEVAAQADEATDVDTWRDLRRLER